ncbi:hypothetical protein ATCC90586_003510 [Pythium insidiosum]|nr:hypothetical protein ATCC90586_003510 [Pythium insidiosum]
MPKSAAHLSPAPSQLRSPCVVHDRGRAIAPVTQGTTPLSMLEDGTRAGGSLQASRSPEKPRKFAADGFGASSSDPLLQCSCDPAEFDVILAAIGDRQSTARQQGSQQRSYGSASTLLENGGRVHKSRGVKKRVVVSAVANLSTAYNLAVINYAMMMIQRSYPPSSPQVTSTVVSCSLVGAILGQLTFGYIGDAIGRRKGMILTLLLSILGALASALLPWGDHTIYPVLAACRFVLGLGVGGVYPLSATTAVESSHDEVKNSKIVAAVFSFQGVGQLLAPLMAYLLVQLRLHDGYGWRILLGIGALPGLFVLRDAFEATETCEYRSTVAHRDASASDLSDVIRQDKSLWRKLLGASLGWFLFDITFYGNVIFTPIILKDTFGFDNSHLKDVTLDSLFVAAMGLPGYITTVLVVGRVDFRRIQIMGFVVMALLFAVLGLFYKALLSHTALLLTLYALTFFFSNFGPNVSTFCLPAEIFPTDVRIKMNGIAAASGKIGATVGAAVFGIVEKSSGVSDVLVLSAIVSLLGAIVTVYLVPRKQYK